MSMHVNITCVYVHKHKICVCVRSQNYFCELAQTWFVIGYFVAGGLGEVAGGSGKVCSLMPLSFQNYHDIPITMSSILGGPLEKNAMMCVTL